MTGQRDRARKVLEEWKRNSTKRYVAPFDIATIYTGLGDKEQTFEWLGKAYQDHSHWLIWLSHDLLRRMGLPP